ncbi:hypothetical protein EROM_111190 [Encephalitozoon romaleae SJ-2008]|uniref:Uncharacterized protein n=1 Tax=Encephalitozoon romaleae (strain SJ-2008) TaxID=1178016 RepID=I7AH17_ENCRO|nr:hypothetical protein EROM_111190 [Encephalitozoon romaleae SJ-2008]AFN84100.1 hypothetical protein EROM_111190 [Encephalitozoon romaleae SJ-2008]
MKNQRTVFVLGCITTGIVMVLFGIDFMMPKRSSVRSVSLVERGRMSLFGKKTSTLGKFAERKDNDRIDVLREKIDLINKKLDRVIKIVEELKSSNKPSSATIGKEANGSTYRESRYSNLHPERSSLSSMSLINQPYYLGERGQSMNIDTAESSRKTRPFGIGLDAFHPKYSDSFALHVSSSGSHSIPTIDKTGASKETERKLEPEATLSKSGEVVSSGLPEGIAIGGTISGGERIEKLIGEFLSEGFANAIKPSPVKPEEDIKESQDKSRISKESKRPKNDSNGQVGLGGSGRPVSQKPLLTNEKGSAYTKKNTQENKEVPTSSLDKKDGEVITKETTSVPVGSGLQKPSGLETKPLPSSGTKGMSEIGRSTSHSNIRYADGSRSSVLYQPENEISYEDASSSGTEEEGIMPGLRSGIPTPRISVIKL